MVFVRTFHQSHRCSSTDRYPPSLVHADREVLFVRPLIKSSPTSDDIAAAGNDAVNNEEDF